MYTLVEICPECRSEDIAELFQQIENKKIGVCY